MKRRGAGQAWYNADRWQVDYDAGQPQTVTINEIEAAPAKTGLLDCRGNELFRREVKNRIGFKWTAE